MKSRFPLKKKVQTQKKEHRLILEFVQLTSQWMQRIHLYIMKLVDVVITDVVTNLAQTSLKI